MVEIGIVYIEVTELDIHIVLVNAIYRHSIEFGIIHPIIIRLNNSDIRARLDKVNLQNEGIGDIFE